MGRYLMALDDYIVKLLIISTRIRIFWQILPTAHCSRRYRQEQLVKRRLRQRLKGRLRADETRLPVN